MELLVQQSKTLTQLVSTHYVRYLMTTIEWDYRLIAIRGPRGVGKTTLLRQHLKLHYGVSDKALYITLDDFFFTETRLIELARQFHQMGGEILYIDEVHKYPHGDWAREIKNIYDLLPQLKVVFTGSSIIRILNEQADLSRRALIYEMQGLSFREFVGLTKNIVIPSFSIQDLLENHIVIAADLVLEKVLKPLVLLKEYLEYGYYPFFLESRMAYFSRLREMLKLVIEVDFNYLEEYTITEHTKINKLLYAIASSAPFKPNIAKLSERIGLNRNRLTQYIYLLERARLLHLLHTNRKGITALQKPDKIYLENTNLMYALVPTKVERGNLRETFFLSHIRYNKRQTTPFAPQTFYPDKGDFLVDTYEEQFLFEVGGSSKSAKQIMGQKNAYLVIDDLEIGHTNKIPLWLFGLLYSYFLSIANIV